MSRRQQFLLAVHAVLLAGFLGCSMPGSDREPPKLPPKKVTVDAPCWSDRPDQDLLRRLNDRRESRSRQRQLSRRPAEHPLGDRHPSLAARDARPARFSPPSQAASICNPEPARLPPISRQPSSTNHIPLDGLVRPVNFETSAEGAPQVNELLVRPTESAAGGDDPQLKGLLLDAGGNAVALVKTAAGQTLFVREGDLVPIGSPGRRFQWRVQRIAERSVYLGQKNQVKVIRIQ